MDGIVPILMLLILLSIFVGADSIIFLVSMILFAPYKLGMRSIYFATFSVAVLGLGSVLAFLANQSIIGHSPLVYICSSMLLIDFALMVKCKRIIKHNNALKKRNC